MRLGSSDASDELGSIQSEAHRIADACSVLQEAGSVMNASGASGTQPLAQESGAHPVTLQHLDIVSQSDGMYITRNDSCKIYKISFKDANPEPNISVKQRADPDLDIILAWLEKKLIPTEAALYSSSPTAKYLWINKEMFILDLGVLKRKTPDGKILIVVPKSMQQRVMSAYHDLPSAGHQGMDRTRHRIKDKYYWFGMTSDINQYISTCASCNRSKKASKQAKYQLTSFQAGLPMERVHLDFLGPLPRSTRGNEYILMMVDQFTKWVECVPLPSQTAEVTAHAAVSEFFSRFGYPFQIHSDQGRNFESHLFSKVCELLGIHKTRTTPYRPSANGQVERFNRTLMDAVRCFVGTQNTWDKFLPQLACAIRSSVNRHTGFTPNKLMLGRETNLPADLIFEGSVSRMPETADEYVKELEASIIRAHKIARDNLKVSQKRMKRQYDVRILQNSYHVGDPVYILEPRIR